MKAAYIHEPCPPEGIQYGELPNPSLEDDKVLVRVCAAAVNPVDTYIRSGRVPMDLPRPYILGSDLAGEVVALGPKARKFRIGQRVWGSNQGVFGRQGTFAEFAAVGEKWLYPAPENVSDETLAAAAMVGLTAWAGLARHARLRRGERVYVSGAGGSVGSMVVQIAKLMGAEVVAGTSSEEKAAWLQEHGADRALDYREGNLPDLIHRIAPGGVNVWWETSREPDLEAAVESLSTRGRLVVMAGREARPPIPIGPFYVKSCSMVGFMIFTEPPHVLEAAARRIGRWLAEKRIEVPIDRVLPLSQTAEAHRLQEGRTLEGRVHLRGKLLVRPE